MAKRPHSQARPIPGPWVEPMAGFDRWLLVADKSPKTRELRRYQLGRVARAFPAGPASVTQDDLVDWLASQVWEAETRRGARAGLRTFFDWATRRGIVAENPAAELPPVHRAHPRPRPVAEDEWRDAREAASPRVQLMMDLGARLGMRRGEIAAVHRRDVVPYGDGWALVVHGKGKRERTVPVVDEDLAARLRQATGWLFPSSRPGQHLTPDWVGRLVRQASCGQWSSHQLRHRFASTVYNACGDLLATQQLLGHSKPETTQTYVQLADKRLLAAVATASASADRAVSRRSGPRVDATGLAADDLT